MAKMGLIWKMIDLVDDCLESGFIPLIASHDWHVFYTIAYVTAEHMKKYHNMNYQYLLTMCGKHLR